MEIGLTACLAACVCECVPRATLATQPSNYNGKTLKIIFSWRQEMNTLCIFLCEMNIALTYNSTADHYYYYFYRWHRRAEARKTSFRLSMAYTSYCFRFSFLFFHSFCFLFITCRHQRRCHRSAKLRSRWEREKQGIDVCGGFVDICGFSGKNSAKCEFANAAARLSND